MLNMKCLYAFELAAMHNVTPLRRFISSKPQLHFVQSFQCLLRVHQWSKVKLKLMRSASSHYDTLPCSQLSLPLQHKQLQDANRAIDSSYESVQRSKHLHSTRTSARRFFQWDNVIFLVSRLTKTDLCDLSPPIWCESIR